MSFFFEVGSGGGYGKAGIQVSVSKVVNQVITDTYICTAIESIQASLNVSGVVGEATVILGNMDGAIFAEPAAQPHAMDILHIRARNRHGIWGPVWTGYIDEVHRVDDPTNSRQCIIKATSPQELFEVRLQSPGDVEALAISSIGGISGSAILRYVCKLPTVNYPGPLRGLAGALGYDQSLAPTLRIDPNADSGIANWDGIESSVFYAPEQQAWSTVLQGVVGNSGVEMFFDEMGSLYWRQPKYLTGLGAKPVIIDEDDLFMRDLFETSNQVLTQVTVRYGQVEILNISQTATTKDAKTGLDPIKNQLGQRAMTVYLNWITDKNTAINVANLLLQIYASNVLCGSIIIPANPSVRIGSLLQIPTGRRIQAAGLPEWGVYYVASIAYALTWGSQWIMVVGLQYGRGVETGWPYQGAVPYPQISVPKSALPTNKTVISVDPNNPAKINQKFTIKSDPTLGDNEVITDPNIIPPGTQIIITSTDGKSTVGTSNTGVYTAVAGIPGQGLTMTIKAAGPDTQGLVTISQGTPENPVFTGDPSGGDSGTPSVPYDPNDAANLADNAFSGQPFSGPYAFEQAYGNTGNGFEPAYTDPSTSPPNQFFSHFHTGIDLSSGDANAPILSVCPGMIYGISSPSDLPPQAVGYHCDVVQNPCIAGVDFIGFGNNVVVLFGRYLVHYAHMSQVNVRVGDKVATGTVLGLQGSTTSDSGQYGTSTGPHLHLGVWDGTLGTSDQPGGWTNPIPFFTRNGINVPP